jgi:hypothetical protein
MFPSLVVVRKKGHTYRILSHRSRYQRIDCLYCSVTHSYLNLFWTEQKLSWSCHHQDLPSSLAILVLGLTCMVVATRFIRKDPQCNLHEVDAEPMHPILLRPFLSGKNGQQLPSFTYPLFSLPKGRNHWIVSVVSPSYTKLMKFQRCG